VNDIISRPRAASRRASSLHPARCW